jgi:hypothetical protein
MDEQRAVLRDLAGQCKTSLHAQKFELVVDIAGCDQRVAQGARPWGVQNCDGKCAETYQRAFQSCLPNSFIVIC